MKNVGWSSGRNPNCGSRAVDNLVYVSLSERADVPGFTAMNNIRAQQSANSNKYTCCWKTEK
jgi:hypothetical protein